MSFEEIQRLDEQHQQGALSKAEFEDAKRKLIKARTPDAVRQMRGDPKKSEQRIGDGKRMNVKTKTILALVGTITIIIIVVWWLIYRH